MPDGVSMSLTAHFTEALVDQSNHHGALAYRSRAPFNRPTPDIASGEQPGQVRFREATVDEDSGHPSRAPADELSSAPVRTYPAPSRASPTLAAPWVRGTPPMQTKSASADN